MNLSLTANVEVQVAKPGRFFRMLSATGTVKVKFTDQGEWMPLSAGRAYESAAGWDGVTFLSETSQVIEFISILEGKFYDDSLIVGSSALETTPGARTYGASSSVSLTDAAATSIVAASASRKGVAIRNTSASVIHLHNSAITTESAITIPAGAILEVDSNQAWFGYQSSGAAITVWISEIT